MNDNKFHIPTEMQPFGPWYTHVCSAVSSCNSEWNNVVGCLTEAASTALFGYSNYSAFFGYNNYIALFGYSSYIALQYNINKLNALF